MGAVSIHRHEPAEAIPYFEKYVALKPDDPRGAFSRSAPHGSIAASSTQARQELQAVAARPGNRRGRALLPGSDRAGSRTISRRRGAR